jgi:ABC-type lipoprotein export system ATPase subunit
MLRLQQVKKAYRQPNGETVQILDVPKYSLNAGEAAVLMGASGGGKTTLLHIIAGITKADSGQVLLDGIDLCKYRETSRDLIRAAKIGYVFQTFNLLPGFSALENVVLGMTFGKGKKDTARAHHLLERVGLSHRKHNKPKAMSVGEQQRVAVARALANKPKLLLADEPTANVDPANQQQIIDLIVQNCREENIALLMVTHAPEVAKQFSRVDRLDDINHVMRSMAKT